jgi:hypothetical protein
VTGWLLSPRQEVKEILRSQEELDISHSLVYHGEVSGFDIIKEFVVGRDKIPELFGGSALRYAF